jgi:hypothetical protein
VLLLIEFMYIPFMAITSVSQYHICEPVCVGHHDRDDADGHPGDKRDAESMKEFKTKLEN